MKDDVYERLLELPPEDLARALCELADRDRAAKAYVERLVQTPKEAVKRFKARIAGLKRATRFVPRSGAPDVARGLIDDLAGLRDSGVDPRTGAELVVAFFDTASATFNRCDDSYGSIGNVFRGEAVELFVDFAARCDDTEWLRDVALKSVLVRDGYGVRDVIASRAAEYLPRDIVRELIETFVSVDREDSRQWTARPVAAELAVALGDAALFERIRTLDGCELKGEHLATLARLHLANGDAAAAREAIERVPTGSRVLGIDELRLAIYERVGDMSAMEETAWESFRAHRTLERLETLLAIVGSDRRESIVQDEVAGLIGSGRASSVDLDFMLDVGASSVVEDYILGLGDRLNGDAYSTLVPLATRLEDERPLAATIVYRALIDSILRRAKSKIYPHAVSYLKKLNALAPRVSSWRGAPDHAAYAARIATDHARKPSFWSLVTKAKA